MTRLDTEALVVRTVAVGEADVVVTLVTERAGKVAAVARGARKGSRRMAGCLEPVHTIAALLDEGRGDLATLKEAHIVRARPNVVSDLHALEAAGTALRWARELFAPRTPEPEGWRVLVELLDSLDAGAASPRAELARAGLGLLAAVGYALELERCVACGLPCPSGKPACIDAARGGLVCRACGGAATVLSGEEREVARALARGALPPIDDGQASQVLRVLDGALSAHGGVSRGGR